MNHQAVEALTLLQGQIEMLKLLPRTGWLQRGLRDVESVAEHSFGVAALALVVGDLYPDLDRGRVLAMAIVHDMAEALIGDLPASASRLLGKAAKYEAERRAMLELFGRLPRGAEYVALWEEYSQAASKEARLVKALDRLEMLAQALAYERAGASGLTEFWEERNGWGEEFPEVRALTEWLFAEHERMRREA
ncbi:HD domain-containing protein [Candidatus Viridilinea mediisalina]|uniref:5'-deoxynucleotidase n=1 Tax=Candidatus Viridilinea mediisalina TaxID=2024553 RepID=A0A2A6RDZ6_9CHLR|nr:HD domain-containing protein [Candidatus Viridilinea mediisalina]PDW00532.1 phosphohydrolase [Candidatus Viridilinea mediisalina]